MNLIHFILHIDSYLGAWALVMGPWLYLVLFLIVFCETGLVVTPFLPGDSLLFALGSLATIESSPVNLWVSSLILIAAAFVGDNVNYFLGRKVGPKVFSRKESKLFNQDYLLKTRSFCEKHGPKAVVMARFVPIVRTFVPFVAGIGQMPYFKFLGFSFLGSLAWTQIFLWAGFYFGGLPMVKRNFELVIFAVIFVSILPALVSWLKTRSAARSI